MADYKTNIGAYQDDVPNNALWRQNIGADQTDAPQFGDVDKVIQGTSSIDIASMEIDVDLTGIDLEAVSDLVIPGVNITNAFEIGHVMGDIITDIRPGQNTNCDQGSAAVAPWSAPAPTEMPDLVGTGARQQIDQRPMDNNDFTGAGQIRGHEHFWYEMAHLLPRVVQELGNLVSEQVINCDLYNADRDTKITVSSITNNSKTPVRPL